MICKLLVSLSDEMWKAWINLSLEIILSAEGDLLVFQFKLDLDTGHPHSINILLAELFSTTIQASVICWFKF